MRNSLSKRLAFAATASIGALCVAMPVLAQAPGVAEDEPENLQNEPLGTSIIVTAQFREQELQDTPLAITAVNSQMLEARSQTNISEITAQAPNVTLKPQGAAFGPRSELRSAAWASSTSTPRWSRAWASTWTMSTTPR